MSAGVLLDAAGLLETTGRALLHSTWISGACVAAWAIATRIPGLRGPRARHDLGLVCLLAACLLPVLAVLPDSGPPATVVSALETEALDAGTGSRPETPTTGPARAPETLERALPWIARLWLLGLVVALAREIGGSTVARRWARRGHPLPETWRRRAAALADRVVGRPVRVLASVHVDVPCVVGALRPIVLVPVAAFHGLPPEQLEAVLLHELAHVRRRDGLAHAMQRAAEALLWFHPAARWLSRRIDAERELACDALVASVAGSGRDLARALAALEDLRGPRPALAATDGDLLRRVRRLVGEPSGSSRELGPRALPVALAAMAVFCLAALAHSGAPSSEAGLGPSEDRRMIQLEFRIAEVAEPTLPILLGSPQREWVGAASVEDLRAEVRRLEEGGSEARLFSAPRLVLLDDTQGSIKTGFQKDGEKHVFSLDVRPRLGAENVLLALHFEMRTPPDGEPHVTGSLEQTLGPEEGLVIWAPSDLGGPGLVVTALWSVYEPPAEERPDGAGPSEVAEPSRASPTAETHSAHRTDLGAGRGLDRPRIAQPPISNSARQPRSTQMPRSSQPQL